METYTKKERNRYLIGLSGQNIIYGIITSSLAYFLQFTILIPALWVGVILSVSRIFDAIQDPFIGALLSKSKHQFKYYLTVLPVPTAILTILCFTGRIYSSSNSSIENSVIIISEFCFYIIWESIYALGDVPITGYPSLLTKNEKDRTKLISLRPIGSMAGSISALLVQPIALALSALFGGTAADERNSFLITVTIFSIIGGAMYQLTAIGSTQKVKSTTDSKANQFKYFITNPLLRKISISGILGSMKAMSGIVLTPLVTYYFASKNPALSLFYTILLGCGSFLGMIISMLFIPKLTEKYSNIKIFVYSNLMNITPCCLLFILYLKFPKNMADTAQLILLFVLTLIIGSCTSISTTVQSLIISDAVELENKISGNRPAAIFFSCQTFIIKIGAGISSLIASLSYVIIHFSSEETRILNEYIANGGIPRLDNSYSVLMNTLFFLFTIPVALSSLLTVIPFLYNNKPKCR